MTDELPKGVQYFPNEKPGPVHQCTKCGEVACREVGEEYGGLSAGGDYLVHECSACGKRTYVELPD